MNFLSAQLFFACLLISAPQIAIGVGGEVAINGGTYRPFFREKDEPDKKIKSLLVDKFPVTNRQFVQFLKNNPKWTRSQVPEVFTAPTYLQHLRNETTIKRGEENFPVTNVTWFAARKYCQSVGKRLPTTDEWEFIADGQNPENLELILNWYGTRSKLTPVAKASANSHGLFGMHGLIWEWVEDFSSSIIVGDSRNTNHTSATMFCGSGALKAKDPSQYATFMRFAFRSSLKANYTGPILGFRCVKDLEP